MEHSDDTEEKGVKAPFTIFGEPIIKTHCQRNAFITGICGGIVSGLLTFLFTSHVRKSTNAALGGYITVTFGMACYCTFMQYNMSRQARMLKSVAYLPKKSNTKSSDVDTTVENT